MFNLLNNYFSVATQNKSGQDSEGAIIRGPGSILIVKRNIKGAIQGIDKVNFDLIYGKEYEGSDHVIYHQNTSLIVNPGDFILTNIVPTRIISDFSYRNNIITYQVIGKREPVKHYLPIRCFEILVQFNKRNQL